MFLKKLTSSWLYGTKQKIKRRQKSRRLKGNLWAWKLWRQSSSEWRQSSLL